MFKNALIADVLDTYLLFLYLPINYPKMKICIQELINNYTTLNQNNFANFYTIHHTIHTSTIKLNLKKYDKYQLFYTLNQVGFCSFRINYVVVY